MYRQYDLKSDDRRTTGWLKCDGTLGAKLRKGALVTLKHDPDRWWEITAVRSQVVRQPPAQFWKVGGLL